MSAWASCNAGYGFPLSSKTNISKFQFDLESGRRRTTLWMCYLQISIYLFSRLYYSLLTKAPILGLNSGLLIFRGKKSRISQDFQGQIRGKIGRFHGIFVGKKSKFVENWLILRDFRGRKVKNSQKSSRFLGILVEKNQISKDFQGQILRKIGRFHGKFRGKLRQETISKKQPIWLDFFWQISLKSINFASI